MSMPCNIIPKSMIPSSEKIYYVILYSIFAKRKVIGRWRASLKSKWRKSVQRSEIRKFFVR